MVRRPVLPGDISAAARALLAVAPCARAGLCSEIFTGAQIACAYVEQTGRLHSKWGDGTLNAAARRFELADEPSYDNPDYLASTQLVLEALAITLRLEDCAHTCTAVCRQNRAAPPVHRQAQTSCLAAVGPSVARAKRAPRRSLWAKPKAKHLTHCDQGKLKPIEGKQQ